LLTARSSMDSIGADLPSCRVSQRRSWLDAGLDREQGDALRLLLQRPVLRTQRGAPRDSDVRRALRTDERGRMTNAAPVCFSRLNHTAFDSWLEKKSEHGAAKAIDLFRREAALRARRARTCRASRRTSSRWCSRASRGLRTRSIVLIFLRICMSKTFA